MEQFLVYLLQKIYFKLDADTLTFIFCWHMRQAFKQLFELFIFFSHFLIQTLTFPIEFYIIYGKDV